MSERVTLDFLSARLGALQDGLRDLRDSHESLGDRVQAVDATLTNLANQMLHHLTLQDRRLARAEGRLDTMTRRIERLEEQVLRLADMVADLRTELTEVRAAQERQAADIAGLHAGQREHGEMLAEILRRLPNASA